MRGGVEQINALQRILQRHGSLLLGAHDPHGALVYVGDVGTGFTDAARRHLLQQLRPLERPDPPFPGEFVRARG